MLVKAKVLKDGFIETIPQGGLGARTLKLSDSIDKFKEGDVIEVDYQNDKKVVLATPLPEEKTEAKSKKK